MQLYAVCEPWLRILGVWPLEKLGWMLKVYLSFCVGYLLLPEMVFLYRNYKNVEEFGAAFCELMVVVQGIYKLLILMYHKQNWRIVIADISYIFRECRWQSRISMSTAFFQPSLFLSPTDQYFTHNEKMWIKRLQFFIGIYIKLFLVTGIVYIISPNLFALSQYALKRNATNVTLMPETAKIECEQLLRGALWKNKSREFNFSLVFVNLKETPKGYLIYTFLNITTVTYIALVCACTDILYLSTIYFCIFYMQRIIKRLAQQPITFANLRDFSVNHRNIIIVLKRIQRLSKTFMLIMYFSILSMTCFIGLVLTTVKIYFEIIL